MKYILSIGILYLIRYADSDSISILYIYIYLLHPFRSNFVWPGVCKGEKTTGFNQQSRMISLLFAYYFPIQLIPYIILYIYISLQVNDLVKLGLLTLMITTYYYLMGTYYYMDFLGGVIFSTSFDQCFGWFLSGF